MAPDDHENPVVPINLVSLIEKTRGRVYWRRPDLAFYSRVDYTVASAISVRCYPRVELGRIRNRIQGPIVMRWYVSILFACSLIVVPAGCKKDEATQPVSSAKQESNHPEFDVCALITKQEIEAIQRSPIKETKSSVRSDAGFRVFQCFYTAEDFSKSVSLAVTQRDSASSGKRSVKDFWKETLGRFTHEEKESNGDREGFRQRADGEGEEKVFIPPKKIDGIGEDAFWSPNPMGGAIYVLKKDAFIRISIGGHDHEEAKLDKSKALARKAIDRL